MRPQFLSRLHPEQPETLFFAPLAWLKLQWFCHHADTEVGGFGLSAQHNPLYVEDFVTVRQRVSPVSVQFDDAAVADHFDACVDRGLAVERAGRIWLHTHPGASSLPSNTDEETFARTFGPCAWAVMFIVSRTGQTYARLAFSAGPGAQILLPVAVHWAGWPEELAQIGSLDARIEQWQQEYAANIQPLPPVVREPAFGPRERLSRDVGWWDTEPWSEELDGIAYEPLYEGDLHNRASENLRDRDLRQRESVPPEQLAACHAVVIGVGAIGRQVALQLTAVGVPQLTLFDDDTVGVENLAAQGYWPADLGVAKVLATQALCSRINPQVQVTAVPERFKLSSVRSLTGDRRLVIFACVDSITTRKLIWEAVCPRAALFLDGRMSAEVVRVLAVEHPATDRIYATTLFDPGEAYTGSCTARSTIYTASVAAGLLVGQFTRWLRHLPVDPDVTLNLLSMELAVPERAPV